MRWRSVIDFWLLLGPFPGGVPRQQAHKINQHD
jgi:hypothetical protein